MTWASDSGGSGPRGRPAVGTLDVPAERVLERLRPAYEVQRELTPGGMARVFLARDVALDRLVAIKLLPPALAVRPAARARFLREARTAARLSHPHIVPLIDSGESDGVLYYVSPFIPGGSLRDKLNKEKRLSIDEAMRIAHEIATALDYAHRNGFVHRVVKPENILFADDHALLADFGIAHVSSATSGRRRRS